jgi:hypothetical protein
MEIAYIALLVMIVRCFHKTFSTFIGLQNLFLATFAAKTIRLLFFCMQDYFVAMSSASIAYWLRESSWL